MNVYRPCFSHSPYCCCPPRHCRCWAAAAAGRTGKQGQVAPFAAAVDVRAKAERHTEKKKEKEKRRKRRGEAAARQRTARRSPPCHRFRARIQRTGRPEAPGGVSHPGARTPPAGAGRSHGRIRRFRSLILEFSSVALAGRRRRAGAERGRRGGRPLWVQFWGPKRGWLGIFMWRNHSWDPPALMREAAGSIRAGVRAPPGFFQSGPSAGFRAKMAAAGEERRGGGGEARRRRSSPPPLSAVFGGALRRPGNTTRRGCGTSHVFAVASLFLLGPKGGK